MKKFLPAIIIILIIIAGWFFLFRPGKTTKKSTPTESVTAKKHSAEFNRKISLLIGSYLQMKSAFVDADTSEVKTNTAEFIAAADSLNLDEFLEKDSTVYLTLQQFLSDIKANAAPILLENDITEMRHDFSMISENLYPFLKVVGYEGGKLFWQNCPMAFGEDKPANWLSNTREIYNPYLGKKDPVYKSAMLHCGENMDSLYLK